MPLVLRAMLLALLPVGASPAAALESAQVVSSRATASLVTDVEFGGAGEAVPRRPAAAACDRMAHLLAEPWRCRRPAGAAIRPAPGATAGPIDWPTPRGSPKGR